MTTTTFASVVAVALVVCTTAGCPPAVSVCEEQLDLVDVRGWAFVPPADDVVWPAPADAALCTADDIQVQPVGDELALEIDTRLGCGWATATQPLATSLAVGDRLRIRVFYFSQTAFPASTAEVALAIGDDVVVSATVAIPSSSGLLQPEIVVDDDIAAGTAVSFHVGNHGDNSWNLVGVEAIRDTTCD